MTGNWLVPLKGRNISGRSKLNFLCKVDNVYFMDNHKAASWCWEQHVRSNTKINVIHIDAHSDAGIISPINLEKLPDPTKCTVVEYLDIEEEAPCEYGEKVIRWDNYISAFLHSHRQSMNYLMSCTHDSSSFNCLFDDVIIFDDRQKNALYMLDKLQKCTHLYSIVNIDLDYFSEKCRKNDDPERYLEVIAKNIGRLIKRENVCITICLSPECCGGWEEAERLLRVFNQYAGISFKLPNPVL